MVELLCSCGRPAVRTFETERFGHVGWCGLSGVPPLDPCDCPDAGVNRHDRTWCAQARAGIVRGEA